ncbi:DUF6578 domain-containing protein [Streptomyces sp. NPDC051976]|uniref:DUF6578 domain-containing protein n=1 Tax=Streptomyces sp. NPDC051976 TaxID=3154947 RepID=UPI003441DD76
MHSLPVFVADWEMYCCGEPFSVGTEVRWCLHFLYEDEMSVPAQALLPPGSPVTAAASASVAEPEITDGLRGMLSATWHTSAHNPKTLLAGTVRRIRLVRQFTVKEDSGQTVVRAGAQLTELAVSRSRFTIGSGATREDSWQETGLLVDLAMDLDAVIASVSS